jgi:hypothetical protein
MGETYRYRTAPGKRREQMLPVRSRSGGTWSKGACVGTYPPFIGGTRRDRGCPCGEAMGTGMIVATEGGTGQCLVVDEDGRMGVYEAPGEAEQVSVNDGQFQSESLSPNEARQHP